LLGAKVNGESMTRSDLIGACLLLLIAGHETTATLADPHCCLAQSRRFCASVRWCITCRGL
jgi:cytochrome P450